MGEQRWYGRGVGVAGYEHFLALARRAQWDERDVVLTLDVWDDELRQLLANLCLAETAVAEELDPLIEAAPAEARACFEAQQRDERRHARFFARYARAVGTGEPDAEWLDLFAVQLPAVARSGSLADAVGLYHMVLEGTVLTRALHTLVDAGVSGAELVLRDERWHVGLGVRVLQDLGLPEREILSDLGTLRRRLAVVR
jgi:ribonucleoside-diphosphate reductase beta chain